jgi:hypothetical protein
MGAPNFGGAEWQAMQFAVTTFFTSHGISFPVGDPSNEGFMFDASSMVMGGCDASSSEPGEICRRAGSAGAQA